MIPPRCTTKHHRRVFLPQLQVSKTPLSLLDFDKRLSSCTFITDPKDNPQFLILFPQFYSIFYSHYFPHFIPFLSVIFIQIYILRLYGSFQNNVHVCNSSCKYRLHSTIVCLQVQSAILSICPSADHNHPQTLMQRSEGFFFSSSIV